MRRRYFCLLLIWLSTRLAFPQDVRVDTIVDSRFIYWEDGSDGNSRLLNKSLFKDNWFFGIHAGGVYNWGTNSSHASVWGQVRPMTGLSGGKQISPYMSVRIQLSVGNNRGTILEPRSHQTWWALAGYGDVLFDLTNLTMRYRENRKFNFLGLIGLGGERTMWYKKIDEKYLPARVQIADWYLGLRLGLMTRFRVSKVWDFTLEATNSWHNDAYDGISGGATNDPHLNLLAGFVYHFKNHDNSYEFTFARRDREKFKVLNEEVNRLREKTIDEKAFVAANPNIVVVNSQQVNTLISFEAGSYAINEMQQVNVFTTAEAMKRLNNADLYITVLGHETSNVDLFMLRAEAIKRSLINDYGIPAGKIFAEKNPAMVENIDKALDCVIFYINE